MEMQRKFETVKAMMKENRDLDLDEAIDMVEKRDNINIKQKGEIK